MITESNHYGIAGKYSLMAIEKNLIGMSFTNTSPFMTPTRGIKVSIFTNILLKTFTLKLIL